MDIKLQISEEESRSSRMDVMISNYPILRKLDFKGNLALGNIEMYG